MSEDEKEGVFAPNSARDTKIVVKTDPSKFHKYPHQYQQEVGVTDALAQAKVSEAAEEAEFPHPNQAGRAETGTREDHFESGRGLVKEEPIN